MAGVDTAAVRQLVAQVTEMLGEQKQMRVEQLQMRAEQQAGFHGLETRLSAGMAQLQQRADAAEQRIAALEAEVQRLRSAATRAGAMTPDQMRDICDASKHIVVYGAPDWSADTLKTALAAVDPAPAWSRPMGKPAPGRGPSAVLRFHTPVEAETARRNKKNCYHW